ncbi:MAG: peroxiredoxin [Proteobacteria bacterium]|nr:peroxiredoxin [Pseudomonadota bacterium]
MLEPGDKIPAFDLPDQSGQARKLKDLVGKKGLVLYIYPRDNTSGCTQEAREFQENLEHFEKMGYGVAGLSKDSVRSHAGFAEKHGLEFPLLSDPERTLIEPLGGWAERKMAGRTGMGVVRTTLVLDKSGKTLKVYPKVRAKSHAAKVLVDLGEK